MLARSFLLLSLPLIALNAGVGQVPTPGSLLRQTVPSPTGQNGYEEYLRAADLVNDGLADIYIDGPSAQVASSDLAPALIDKRAEVAREIGRLDYLARQEAAARRYGRALELVAQGNLKPCFDPRESSTEARFPEFRFFRLIVRLAISRSYAQAAAGDAGGSLQTLLDGETLTIRMGALNTLGSAYGTVAGQAVFDELAQRMPSLSLREAGALRTYAEARVSEAPPIIVNILRSGKIHDEMMANAFADPEKSREAMANLEQDLRDRLAQPTANDLRIIGNRIRQSMREGFEKIEADLARPETEWYERSAAWPVSANRPRVSANASIEEVADAVYHDIRPSYRALLLRELTRRAQLRLLALHARLVTYRWHQGRQPANLSDFADARSAFDPLSGEPFVFEPRDDGSYRLYSKGRSETGPVELRYKRPEPDVPAEPITI